MNKIFLRLLVIGLVPGLTLFACSSNSSDQRTYVNPQTLREYIGAYQWEPNAFVYLQMWNEFTGTDQLVAFDESGEVRTLYPIDRDHFFT